MRRPRRPRGSASASSATTSVGTGARPRRKASIRWSASDWTRSNSSTRSGSSAPPSAGSRWAA
jgi:hypothetical protein